MRRKPLYLVTGGAGFLGSALVRRLCGEGRRVRVLDNGSRGDPRRLKGVKNWEWLKGDIRDAAACARAAKGVDAVFHLAFINGTKSFYERPSEVLEVGVKGAFNIIEASVRAKVPEFFLASSSEVYQNPPAIPTPEDVVMTIPSPFNPRYSYAAGKILSEIIAIHTGGDRFKRLVIFRPHNVYGPDMGADHVIPQLAVRLAGLARGTSGFLRPVLEGSGRQTRSFIFIDDFVEGLALLIRSGKHRVIYNIGTQEEVSISALAREIGKVLGRSVRPVAGQAPEGSPNRRCPDVSKLRRLGFRAKTSLAAGLSKTVPWYARSLA